MCGVGLRFDLHGGDIMVPKSLEFLGSGHVAVKSISPLLLTVKRRPSSSTFCFFVSAWFQLSVRIWGGATSIWSFLPQI